MAGPNALGAHTLRAVRAGSSAKARTSLASRRGRGEGHEGFETWVVLMAVAHYIGLLRGDCRCAALADDPQLIGEALCTEGLRGRRSRAALARRPKREPAQRP